MTLYSMEEFCSSTIEIFLGRILKIKINLEKLKQEELTKTLQNIMLHLHGSTST